MPLLGFQKQFAPLVESGKKRQTIRPYRKDGRDPKVGDMLYFYSGLRTNSCRKLGEAVCSTASRIELLEVSVRVCDRYLTPNNILSLALRDGFKDSTEMRSWFDKTHGLPFEGLLIRWGGLSND